MNRKDKKINKLADTLRENGEKATKARIEILSVLSHEQYPISAKDIARQVKAPDQSTLYRALKTLSGKKIINEIILEKNQALYEIALGRKHHHHIICTCCGLIEDTDICLADEERRTAKRSKQFSQITGHAMEFWGICRNCSRKSLVR